MKRNATAATLVARALVLGRCGGGSGSVEPVSVQNNPAPSAPGARAPGVDLSRDQGDAGLTPQEEPRGAGAQRRK
jgi:hypothetical protein